MASFSILNNKTHGFPLLSFSYGSVLIMLCFCEPKCNYNCLEIFWRKCEDVNGGNFLKRPLSYKSNTVSVPWGKESEKRREKKKTTHNFTFLFKPKMTNTEIF